MALDIMLDLERLRATQEGLDLSITEFTNAGAINNGLESDIAKPDGRGTLRGKAGDFESAWNDKRDKLAENLTNIQEQLTAIIDGWADWDTETASCLTPEASTQSVTSNRYS